MEKRRNLEQFSPLFHNIFFCLLLDVHVWAGTRFSLRDKRLFEMSEFEITRVNCNFLQQVWVLTGDKEETAVNISHSAGHFDSSMVELRITQLQSSLQCAEHITSHMHR